MVWRDAKNVSNIFSLFSPIQPQIAGVVVNGILHGNEDTGRALDRLAEMDDVLVECAAQVSHCGGRCTWLKSSIGLW